MDFIKKCLQINALIVGIIVLHVLLKILVPPVRMDIMEALVVINVMLIVKIAF